MTHAKQALDRLSAFAKLLPRASAGLQGVSASAKAVIALKATDSAMALPAASVLDAVRVRLIGLSNGSRQYARSDLRDAVWLLWSEKESLDELPGLLDAVWAQALKSNATARALIEAWLRGFSQSEPSIARTGMAIRQVLIAKPTPRLELWRMADRRIDLFDARYGPRKLASWLVIGPEGVDEILSATGLDDPLRAAGGFLRAVQQEVVANVSSVLAGSEAQRSLERILTFLAPDGRLRLSEPRSRAEMTRGLLRAWLEGMQEPTESIRAIIQQFLLEHMDDPRLKPQRWQEAGEPATNLMRRWLTRASLKAFFSLISDHALDAHWRYREAFWTACIEKNAAVEAWLALGSRIHASARSVEDLKGAYARLEGAGGDQAVLLLRVKNTIFCEWSHSGALRAWPVDWSNAPLLGRKLYTKASLLGKCLPFPPKPRFRSRGAPDGRGLHHHGSDQSRWQGSAAELLERRTQIVLSPTDWMPR
jgi:hypothetical protein